MPDTSLYSRLGGETAIMAAVEIFYRRVLADPATSRFFNGIDLAAQSRKMIGFMAVAFGGPKEHQGRDLRTAHARLVREQGLNHEHFDKVALHLKETLEELGVAKPLVDEALGIVATTRDAVLGG